jgi:TonB-dependent SusC/RagA subfamily outer membrane receptor
MNLNKPLPAWFSLILIVLILLSAGFADEDLRYRRIRDALNKFTYLYPQQKVFLHLDKDIYRGGDDMWIKAYLISGLDHLPDTISTNLYVELISPFQTRVEIKRFQMFTGYGIGDFKLSDTLPEGLYQIRAFTNWMQNFDAAFYFERNFQLINPGYRKIISPKQARINKKEIDNREQMAGDIDLQFMPEGGYMVDGIESVVAFKAINRLGKGVDTEGTIIDDKGNTVISFKSFFKGIGTFIMKPEKGKKYFAVTRNGDKDMRTPLPLPLETGLVMHAEDYPNKVSLRLISNKIPTADPTANELILVGQVGGRFYYKELVRLENGKAELEIPKAGIPGGIMQVTAFSGRGEPLSERLVFVHSLEYMKINISASDTLTDEGKKIVLYIQTTDGNNNPLEANLSLAVTRQLPAQSPVDHDNILSNLILSSDLKGYVEDPLEYFESQSPGTLKALDNLMLTQGWRRFDWNKILAGEYPKIDYYEERGLTVFGKVTHDFFNIPLKNCLVRLSVMDAYNDVFTQSSSKNGTFLFENMVYYDTVSIKIEAFRPSGRRNLLIILPEEKENNVVGQQGDFSLTTLSERDNKAYRLEQAEKSQQAYQKEQERLKEERKNELTGIYGEPDAILRSEDLPKGNNNILEALKGRIPGVQVNGDQVLIRGRSTIYGSSQPLFLLDGMPVNDVGIIRAIPLEDIERVEVLKGPSASIYGMRGANGVIAVYTKRGHFMVRGMIEFDMLGYNTPREFYQPKYKPGQEPPGNYTLLWKPVIITSSAGKARVIFDKPLIHDNYLFNIQGISYVGHVGFAESLIFNQ